MPGAPAQRADPGPPYVSQKGYYLALRTTSPPGKPGPLDPTHFKSRLLK